MPTKEDICVCLTGYFVYTDYGQCLVDSLKTAAETHWTFHIFMEKLNKCVQIVHQCDYDALQYWIILFTSLNNI